MRKKVSLFIGISIFFGTIIGTNIKTYSYNSNNSVTSKRNSNISTPKINDSKNHKSIYSNTNKSAPSKIGNKELTYNNKVSNISNSLKINKSTTLSNSNLNTKNITNTKNVSNTIEPKKTQSKAKGLNLNKIIIENIEINLPENFTKFKNRGWNIPSSIKGIKLKKAELKENIPIKDDGKFIVANFINLNEKMEDVSDIEKTKVYQIKIDNLSAKAIGEKVTFQLEKGINENSRIENVIKAFGEPTTKENVNRILYYTYIKDKTSYKSYLKIGFDQKTKQIINIEINHIK